MIVKYDEFLSKIPGEVTEVEVDDELGKYIAELDEADFNLNRKETRRHTYMSELEEKRHYIPDDSDPLDDASRKNGSRNSWRRLKSCSRSKRSCLSVCTGTRNIKRISPPMKAFHNRR